VGGGGGTGPWLCFLFFPLECVRPPSPAHQSPNGTPQRSTYVFVTCIIGNGFQFFNLLFGLALF
jgi:hypothetical protein